MDKKTHLGLLEKMIGKDKKIIVTGAAGLVGQNLIQELLSNGYTEIIAIDKNEHNLKIMEKLHPNVKTIMANLKDKGSWVDSFKDAETLFLLHAQITGLKWEEFEDNTIDSTKNVLEAAKKYEVPYTVFVGSSVVDSKKSDNYSNSKIKQEKLMIDSKLPCCILRPTLMFGWFDPKHLGWLSRFMKKSPIFPIPGNGKFIRQPLYVRDFCKAVIWCAVNRPNGKAYNLTGAEDVTYIDIIKTIKQIQKCHTIVLKIPIVIFRMLLRLYSIFSKNPPFVSDQLDSLIVGDYFTGDSFKETFNIDVTTFRDAMLETLTKEPYCSIVLDRTINK
ncbi:MAG: NAD(P)-dependent oxidoreductase [Bacteroidales bacterium]|nr:NAD(P)-dependent oxidoreductase [Bacteroidales bacterium]